MRLLLALLLAYIPSTGSLLRRAAARVSTGGKAREVSFTGTLTVAGEATRDAQLVLHFPLGCQLAGDGGLALEVKGTVEKPLGEPGSAAAQRLLQMACPYIAYRGLPAADAELALRAAALAHGADLNGGSALARLQDRPVYVLGGPPRDLTKPQVWLYKDSSAPARVIAQGGTDLRLLQYGNPAAADWFPRVLELWEAGKLSVRFEALEAHGMRGTGEEEEDDSRAE